MGTGVSVIAFITMLADKKYRHYHKRAVALQEVCTLLFALVALLESIPAWDRDSVSLQWGLEDVRWDI